MLSLFQDFDQLFAEHSRVNLLSFWDLTTVALVYSWGWLMVLNYIYIKVDKSSFTYMTSSAIGVCIRLRLFPSVQADHCATI